MTGLRAEDRRSSSTAATAREGLVSEALRWGRPGATSRRVAGPGAGMTLGKGRGAARSAFSPPQAALTQGSRSDGPLPAKCPGWWQGPAAHGAERSRSSARGGAAPLWPHCQQAYSSSPLPVEPARVRCSKQDLRGQVHPRRPVWLQLRRHGRVDVRGHGGPGRAWTKVLTPLPWSVLPPLGSGRVSKEREREEDEQACGSACAMPACVQLHPFGSRRFVRGVPGRVCGGGEGLAALIAMFGT